MNVLTTPPINNIILSYFGCQEYYESCRYKNIPLELDLYFKNLSNLPKLSQICSQKIEYLDVVECLFYIYNKTIKQKQFSKLLKKSLNHASSHGRFQIVKFLYNQGVVCTRKTLTYARKSKNNKIYNFVNFILYTNSKKIIFL